jgi:hypothetical protein
MLGRSILIGIYHIHLIFRWYDINSGHYFRQSLIYTKQSRKLHIVIAGVYFVFNSSLGSSIASGAHDEISEYFNIPGESIEMVLPTSLYMAGFAIGMSDIFSSQ